MPREIAEPSSAIIFDNTRHGDRDGFDTGENEIYFNLLDKRLIEFILVEISEKFDGV